jgi:hypothetical protein
LLAEPAPRRANGGRDGVSAAPLPPDRRRRMRQVRIAPRSAGDSDRASSSAGGEQRRHRHRHLGGQRRRVRIRAVIRPARCDGGSEARSEAPPPAEATAASRQAATATLGRPTGSTAKSSRSGDPRPIHVRRVRPFDCIRNRCVYSGPRSARGASSSGSRRNTNGFVPGRRGRLVGELRRRLPRRDRGPMELSGRAQAAPAVAAGAP